MAEDTFYNLGRIEAIRRLYEGSTYRPFRAAQTFPAKDEGVTCASRSFMEGVDFDLTYFPLQHLGHKCVTAVTGSLLAGFARPKTLTVRLGVSSKLDFTHMKMLWEGISRAAGEYAYEDLDLDIAPSINGLFISVSAVGTVIRDSSRPPVQTKDLLCISGSLGGAYFGFRVLEAGKKETDEKKRSALLEKHRLMVGDYLHPQLDPHIVDQMEDSGIIPSYGQLTDRGLADAVLQAVRDTGLGAKVYAERIPFEGNSFDLGREMGVDTVTAAMNGGEDYRLLYVVPIAQFDTFRHDFQTFEVIGHMAQSDVGAVLVTPDGVELPMKAQGWPEND